MAKPTSPSTHPPFVLPVLCSIHFPFRFLRSFVIVLVCLFSPHVISCLDATSTAIELATHPYPTLPLPYTLPHRTLPHPTIPFPYPSYNPVPWSKRQRRTSANTADVLRARQQGFNARYGKEFFWIYVPGSVSAPVRLCLSVAVCFLFVAQIGARPGGALGFFYSCFFL